jgi:hypothetical protein
VDPRDGRGRERLLADLGEDGGPEVGLDHGAHDVERHRRNVVDEPAQLLDVRVGQQVRPRGEDLTELDERRAELLERLAELAGALRRRVARIARADLAQDARRGRGAPPPSAPGRA